jgi:hypothetical protein
MRAPDYHRWGANADGNNGNQGSSNAYRVFTRSIYATITQDWGALTIGRLEENFPTAQSGLVTLGYNYGGDYIYTLPFDNSGVVDGISYTKKFDNGFGINAYYAKDETFDPTNDATPDKDVDVDRFGVEPFYTWDGGGVALHLEYVRDMGDTDDSVIDYINSDPNLPNIPSPLPASFKTKDYSFFINPAVTQTWGAFSIRFEGKIGWGESEYTDGNQKYKIEKDGLGLYAEANYNYGAGDINLLAWYVDGTSGKDIDENVAKYGAGGRTFKTHDLVDVGDFAPFLVAYYGNTLGGRVGENGPGTFTADIDRGILAGGVNHWGIGVLGNHSFTDAIKFNYGVGFFELVNEYWEGQSKDLGMEIDVGVNIQLLDNLTFETQFGYLFNGKAFKDDNRDPDPKDTYAWLSALTFSF